MSIERNFLNYLFLSKSDLDSFLIWQDFFPTQRQAQTLRGGKNRNVHIETAIQTRGQSVTMMNHHTLSQVSSQIIYFGWNRRRFFHFLSFFYKMNDNLNFNATPLCWLLEFILLEAPRWAGEETNKCKCKSLLDKDNKCLTNLNNKTISFFQLDCIQDKTSLINWFWISQNFLFSTFLLFSKSEYQVNICLLCQNKITGSLTRHCHGKLSGSSWHIAQHIIPRKYKSF